MSIQVGVLQRTRQSSAPDEKVEETLRNFAYATGAPLNSTPVQLADHVLREITRYMVSVAKEYTVRVAMEEAELAAKTAVDF
jgi:hypothetical protein